MDSRGVIRAAVRGEKTERVPLMDLYWPETIANWVKDGYPEGTPPSDYFDLDVVLLSADFSPRLEQRIVEGDEERFTFSDRMGYTAEKARKTPTLHFIDHVTRDRESWENLKKRWVFDPRTESESRIDDKGYFLRFAPYPSWEEAVRIYRRVYAKGKYLLLNGYGPWEATWRHRGYENLLMDLALDPDWVSEMAAFQTQMALKTLRYGLELGIKPDGYFMVDDLGSNRGPIFNPETWRQIFKPLYAEVGAFLADAGVDFWLHCCGNAEPLFSDFIDCGVKVIQPLQASASLYAPDLRKKYGKRLTLCGNISCVVMENGSLDDFSKEALPKVNLAADGCYIYHSDHSVPSGVPFAKYRAMLNMVKAVRFP